MRIFEPMQIESGRINAPMKMRAEIYQNAYHTIVEFDLNGSKVTFVGDRLPDWHRSPIAPPFGVGDEVVIAGYQKDGRRFLAISLYDVNSATASGQDGRGHWLIFPLFICPLCVVAFAFGNAHTLYQFVVLSFVSILMLIFASFIGIVGYRQAEAWSRLQEAGEQLVRAHRQPARPQNIANSAWVAQPDDPKRKLGASILIVLALITALAGGLTAFHYRMQTSAIRSSASR